MTRHGADTSHDATSHDIEFLAPNAAAFGTSHLDDLVSLAADDAVFDEPDDEPRPRWLTAIAGVVIVGFIAAGVVAAAPWDTPVATPAPSTTFVTTAASPPTTTRPSPATLTTESIPVTPTGWLADLHPDEWVLGGAYSRPDMFRGQQQLDVWAAPGASRTEGRWLVVRRGGSSGRLLPDAARTMAGERPAAVSQPTDGVTTVDVRLDDQLDDRGTTAQLQAHGLDLAELIGLAATLPARQATTAFLDYGSVLDTDGRLLGLDLRSTGEVAYEGFGLFGFARAAAYYQRLDSPGSVELSQRPLDDVASDDVLSLLLDPVEILPGSPEAATVDQMATRGRAVSVRALPEDLRQQVVTWVEPDTLDGEGEQLVAVTGYGVDTGELLQVAQRARPADIALWGEMVRGTANAPGNPSGNGTLSMSDASGTFSSGEVWGGQIGTTSAYVNDGTTGGFIHYDLPMGSSVQRFASVDLDVVVAASRWPDTARIMRVTVEGQEPFDIPMEQVGDEAIFAAMYPSIDRVPVTVELLDSSGVPVGP